MDLIFRATRLRGHSVEEFLKSFALKEVKIIMTSYEDIIELEKWI
jgi:hypothetical protein